MDYGIQLFNSSNNEITYNYIHGTSPGGIRASYSPGNPYLIAGGVFWVDVSGIPPSKCHDHDNALSEDKFVKLTSEFVFTSTLSAMKSTFGNSILLSPKTVVKKP